MNFVSCSRQVSYINKYKLYALASYPESWRWRRKVSVLNLLSKLIEKIEQFGIFIDYKVPREKNR
jgi:hypothetical protein